MKNIFLGLISILLCSSLLAQGGVNPNDLSGQESKLDLNTITTALPFMAITPDSRAGGMGDAGTALSGNSSSIYWNTSMLIFAEDKSEVSVSYTPWLRQLTNDIHLSYLSGYSKIGDRHVAGGSLRYFSLGEITFTDNQGNIIRNDKPNEFELTGSYAFRMGQRTSIGLNGKFVYSNLTGGLVVEGIDSKAAIAGAADLSFTFYNDEARIGKTKGVYTFAATINNLGNKVAYSSQQNRDFIPMNLKIGNSFKAQFDKYNSLTFAVDLQKMLVPTPMISNARPGYGSLPDDVTFGKSNDVGVIAGLLNSFTDAPGTPVKNEDGSYEDNTGQVVKGSKLKEELSEINICGGLEYWYNNMFAVRGGYFWEARNKGNRQYFNIGVGLKYNKFGLDFSYLAAVGGRQSPLANTVRFTLRFTINDNNRASSDDTAPE